MALTNVTKGRTHRGGGDTKDTLDGLAGPSELSNDLRGGELGEGTVGPGVDGDFVALHVLLDEDGGPLDDARSDDEEGGGDILFFEVVEEVLGEGGGTVVERNTPGVLVRAGDDI